MKIYKVAAMEKPTLNKRRVMASIKPEDVLIHNIEENFSTDQILAAIRRLGEESIAGFSPVEESEVFDVLAICSQAELGEILSSLQKGVTPTNPPNTYSEKFEQMATGE